MAAEAAGDEAPASKKLSFLDLPAETQQDIISHCSQADLICVALVSKHFHELASTHLYRNFHIIFPDDDDINFDSPIDGLAGGLDTFTTSDYNYAKHLKDLSMDSLSAGPKGELSYQSYLYNSSCGKFLNTLLYLTLKRAKALEAFRWNIRVELSRPVYQELHRIASLKKLHIRMQAGESYYIPPPPLPATSADAHPAEHSTHWADIAPPLPPPTIPSTLSLPLTGNPPPMPSVPPSALVAPSRSLPKSKAARRGPPSQEPPTLSGFKNLKSLSVLDIDDLDIMTELKTCVKNSSSTLSELQLSLSESLASQARKPPPDSDPDDSDIEDDFQVVPHSQSPGLDGTGPAKAFRAQEERKVQEAVLGRIFDVEYSVVNRPLVGKAPGEKIPREAVSSNEAAGEGAGASMDPRKEFISSIRSVSEQLMALVHGTEERPAAHQEILETIEKAAKKYVDSTDALEKNGGIGDDWGTEPCENGVGSQPIGDTNNANVNVNSGNEATASETPQLAAIDQDVRGDPGIGSSSVTGDDPPTSSKGKDVLDSDAALDEIDMEHVDTVNDALEEFDDQKSDVVESSQIDSSIAESATSNAAGPSAPNPASTTSRIPKKGLMQSQLLAKLRYFQDLVDSLRTRAHAIHLEGPEGSSAEREEFKELQKKMEAAQHMITQIANQINSGKAGSRTTEKEKGSQSTSGADSSHRCISDYVRDTRGFTLETLSIYLIPVKASVLSRAVDLRSLKQLTLLNVGNQAPIWTLLSKENKVNPLPLRSVYTDNVSDAFLACMSQIEELHELFMLERSAKSKPESFAPRSTNTIDQIRRVVLAKHMPTLKRLMIKDESVGSNWDANEKAMIHICTRGKQLEELAVSLNIQAVHAFMQYFSALTKLRALHILRFKNNDTCIWVMREVLRFIVDNLSHHPNLKLEWIAMEDDRVDRVVQSSESDENRQREPKKRNKGKGKAPAAAAPSSHDTYPVLPPIDLGSESESDSDVELFDSGTRLRFKTVGPLQFYDVFGVKIFDKEIRSGRL